MFVTAVCALFRIKLRWPKEKNIYSKDTDSNREHLAFCVHFSDDFGIKALLIMNSVSIFKCKNTKYSKGRTHILWSLKIYLCRNRKYQVFTV